MRHLFCHFYQIIKDNASISWYKLENEFTNGLLELIDDSLYLSIKNRKSMAKLMAKAVKLRRLIFTQTVFSDRYIAVCHPIRARKIRTKTYGWLLASVAWLFSLGLSSQGSYIQDRIDEDHPTDDRKTKELSKILNLTIIRF